MCGHPLAPFPRQSPLTLTKKMVTRARVTKTKYGRNNTRNAQALRDDYPSLYLISACVGPFGTGDTPLQHYNSVLALQHLQAYADCVIYRGNDDLLRSATDASARKTPAPAPDPPPRVASGGGGGAWRPAAPFSTGRSGNAAAAARRRRGAPVVSTADMNTSLALDMASYFLPTGRAFERFGPNGTPPAASGRQRRARQRQQEQQQEGQQESAPRPFDGGSLMAAACPLPAAKFVDLRSTLSVGPPIAADGGGSGGGGRSSANLSSSRPAASATGKDWAALVNHLGRRTPLSPRRAGGVEDDVCVAAHHIARGATLLGDRATTAAGAGGSKEGWGVGGAGAAEGGGGGGATCLDRRTWYGGGRGGGAEWTRAEAEALSRQASEALRRHHECAEWRTATDVSYSPGMNEVHSAKMEQSG